MAEDVKLSISAILKEGYVNGRKLSPSCFQLGRTPWNYGISQEKITCPHCNKTGGNSIMKRWHFDNCKPNE